MIERSQMDAAEANLRLSQEQARNAEQEYLISVMEVLGGTSQSLLFRQGPDILEYALTEAVDPQWLFGVLARATYDINDDHFPWQISPPPTSTNHQEHYTYAVQTIDREAYGNNNMRNLVSTELERAEQLAKEEEQNASDPEIRMSVAYKWMHQHLGTLYTIHSKYWWAHY